MGSNETESSRPTSSRSRSNTDFSNHTWVPVPDNGTMLSLEILTDILVKFFDETEEISKIMSAPQMATNSLPSSPPHLGGSQPPDAMDYQTMFNSFNTGLTSPFTSVPNQPPFNNTQTSPFHVQTSP